MTARARGALVVAALSAFALIASWSGLARAGDPWVEWHTVRTPHFRIHYHGGLESLAQRTANLAEAARARIAVPLGNTDDSTARFRERSALRDSTIHILLQDVTDSANGSASAIPYNAIRLFVTAPEDQSPLGDYDDWMTELVTHEQTHIVHLDTMSGLPAIVNGILGNTYAPNQVQPHWVLEGLAVALESELTSGGRLRSPIFDMYLRADVLEDNLAGLDEMSHDVRRWPGGDIWYLYGGKFIGWMMDTYGPDVFAAVASDYGQNLIPWGLNRAILHATGKTYPELYQAWVARITLKYEAQARAVRERGLREGTRLTFGGYNAFNPRVVPACARDGAREALLFARDDGHTVPGLYRLSLETPSRPAKEEAVLVARTDGGTRNGSYDPSCGLVFDTGAPTIRHHVFDDLHYQPPHTTSASGVRGSRELWTHSLRARSPDVSPDGRHVVFATNHAGTVTLRIADIRSEGGLERVRRLVPSADGEQAFSPRFSPDGKSVVYSAWTRGGFREIRVVDVRNGTFVTLTHDRATNAQPTWSRDGRIVFFSSTRTGIANVYAYELSTGKISLVTNVVNGAFMPEISADGRTLYYVGYTAGGYDLFSLPLDERKWLEAEPAPDDRPAPHPEPPRVNWPVTAYDPWDTLRPHSFGLDYGSGSFGQAVTIRLSGSDIAGLHTLSGLVTTQGGIVTGGATYSYSGLPAGVSLSVNRSVARRAPTVVDGKSYPSRDESIGMSSGVSYTMHGEYDAHTVNFNYSGSIVRPHYAIGALDDPYTESTSRRSDAFQSSVRFAWRYSSGFRPLFGVSPESGVSAGVSASYAGPPTLSDGTLMTFDGRFATYVKAPWFRHHVFAFGVAGGSAGGFFARRDYYSTGGFADTPDLFRAVTDGIYQSGFVLRGYPPDAFTGKQYNLASLEYRFPFALGGPDYGWVDRGVSTLPFFLHGFWGTLFADYGGAYDVIDPKDPLSVFHLGAGG